MRTTDYLIRCPGRYRPSIALAGGAAPRLCGDSTNGSHSGSIVRPYRR